MSFTVITDHASLKWLMTLKDLTGRLARWSLKLQGFNFNIIHRKGSENVVPDTLSRVDIASSPEFNSIEYTKLKTTIQNHTPELPD